jgi:hypothetical protein
MRSSLRKRPLLRKLARVLVVECSFSGMKYDMEERALPGLVRSSPVTLLFSR